MDFGFEGFESSGLDMELEDLEIKKVRKFDRQWKAGQGGSVCAQPIIDQNMLYVAAMDSHIYAIDCESGKEVWRFRAGKYGIGGSVPNVHADKIYFGSKDGDLYVLNLDGKEIWRFRAGGPVTAQFPQFHNGKIIFGCEDGNVYFLDFSGKEIGRFKTGGGLFGRMLLHDGKIFFGSWDCRFYCVDIESRKELWRCQTSTMVQSYLPPSHAAFSAEIKKSTQIEDAISEDNYKSKKKGEIVSLSDYHVVSEYATTSEYKQKSDYDMNSVMFETHLSPFDQLNSMNSGKTTTTTTTTC